MPTRVPVLPLPRRSTRSSRAASASPAPRSSPRRARSKEIAPAAVPSVALREVSATFARFDLSLEAVIAGLEVLARHARRALVAEIAGRLVEAQRDLRAQLRSVGSLRGWFGQARLRGTGSKLRWEWLAATGATLDGAPDRRLLTECVTAGERLSEVTEQLAPLAGADDDLRTFLETARDRVRQLLRVAADQLAQLAGLTRAPA